jgi:glycosyltransferase involved in cell wall biosynthesis
VLVPTAERDAAIGLAIFPPIFRGVRAIMYNSFEERALIESASGRTLTGVVVGVGSEIPLRSEPSRFRQKFGITRPFALYVGRIDENKGCPQLFTFFERYASRHPNGLDLVLIGSNVIEIPKHPRIRHLGFLPDQDKFDALAAADVLIMPSPFESLSMVVLEAWALGKPVLVNGECDVLRGQTVRSHAGLYYETFEEFDEALYALEASGPLATPLGSNGREYFQRHYTWPVVERKYLDMFERLKREPAPEPIAPLSGLFARRRRDVPAGREVLETLASGPVI